MNVLVVAKAPTNGRVKTRLCPPCTPDQAARVAEAALADTLDAALATGASCVLALDGEPGPWLPSGVRVVAQQGPTFADRLEHAWAGMDGRGPTVQIGMDTPQVTPALLADALAVAASGRAGLGPAEDGGWWALALSAPMAGAFAGVPMSTDATGAHQQRRLESLGVTVERLPMLRDVDTFADAVAVAAAAPGSRFAHAVAVR